MKYKYEVRFFTQVTDKDGDVLEENKLADFSSNNYIPIPQVDETVLLDDDEANMYRVKKVAHCFPYQENEEYNYTIDIVVEAVDQWT